ncbi:MAG: hypothetical protein PVG71_08460 [Anaerolineae bacterium]|jgi:hypothetical protein
MRERARATELVADFFTQSYRVSGRVDARLRKLADQLEDRTTSFLHLEDAYISSLEHPGDIIASHALPILRKERMVAVLVAREEDGLSSLHSYGSYRGGHLQKAVLIIPSLEVQGYLRLSGKRDLRSVVTAGNQFVPMLDARMTLSTRPDIEFTGGLVLVNRAHVEAMWETE